MPIPGIVFFLLLQNAAQQPDFPRDVAATIIPGVIAAGEKWIEVWHGAVHAVRGGKSDYVSDEDVRRLRAAGACVDTLADAGHFLHVDRPRELLDQIVRGLA